MHKKKQQKTRSKTPTFLLELPLSADPGQGRRLRARFEAARCLYNTLLGEATSRLRRMRADPRWQEARAIPRTHKQKRSAAFALLRHAYGFSAYALHAVAKDANCTWIADHLDAVTAQTLATRAYLAANRVCLGKARRVRFRSRGRGLDSLEGKRNNTGLRFVLQPPHEGNQGWLLWDIDRIPAIIDWSYPVIKHGLSHRIKYARLLRRKASSPKAQGADAQVYRYYVQLVLEGLPYQKPKNKQGAGVVGLDLGPSTLAVAPRQGGGTPSSLVQGTEARCTQEAAFRAQAGPAAPCQQSAQLRQARARQKAWERAPHLEEQPGLPHNQTEARPPGTQTCRAS